MKTKKTFIAVLAAVLVISTVLIASCIAPLEEIVKPKAAGTQEATEYPEIDSNYQVPAGKGVIRFKISEKNIRTIMPVPDAATTLENMFFTIVFTDRNSGAKNKTFTKIDWTEATNALAVEPATFDVSITAFDSTKATAVAGWDSLSDPTYKIPGVVVNSGSSTSVTAVLKALLGTSNGTFSYSINVPNTTVCTTTFQVTNYSDNSVTPIVLIPNQVNTSTQSLVSGYYIVDIIFSKPHCQTVQYTHALHIYPAMTSTLPVGSTTAPGSLVQNEFLINFSMGSEALDNASGTFDPVYIGYASTLSSVATPAPTDPDKTFVGWYTAPGLAPGDAWQLSTRRVFAADNNTTLYPKYQVATNATFTIEFDIIDNINGMTPSGTSINRGLFDGASEYNVTFTLATPKGTGNRWVTVNWRISGLADNFDYSTYQSNTGSNVGNVLTVSNNGNIFGGALADSYFLVSVFAEDSEGEIYSIDPVRIDVVGP